MPGDVVRELDQFAGHDVLQAVDAGDAVADRDHGAGFGDIDRLIVILNFVAQYARDFICSDVSHKENPLPISSAGRAGPAG